MIRAYIRGVPIDLGNDIPMDVLSEEEYNTLSEEDRNSGIYGVIADSNIPSGSGNQFYSLEEIVVGRWIDGRPVYRRTIMGSIPDTAHMNANDSIIGKINDVDIMVALRGSAPSNASLDDSFPLPYSGHVGDIGLHNFKGDIFIYWNITNQNTARRIAGRTFHVIAEYTKITDISLSSTPMIIPEIYEEVSE